MIRGLRWEVRSKLPSPAGHCGRTNHLLSHVRPGHYSCPSVPLNLSSKTSIASRAELEPTLEHRSLLRIRVILP